MAAVYLVEGQGRGIMAYDPNRFINLAILLSQQLDQEKLFDLILKEAISITNCDAGTIYTMDKGMTQLNFRKVITRSKRVELSKNTGASFVPPVPMSQRYICSYVAINRQRMNIPDVYQETKFDFSGTKKYDERNHYQTRSMLVVPMIVAGGLVTGVLQLINALDAQGRVIHFKEEDEWPVMALCSIAALFVENLILKGEL